MRACEEARWPKGVEERQDQVRPTSRAARMSKMAVVDPDVIRPNMSKNSTRHSDVEAFFFLSSFNTGFALQPTI